MDEQKLYDILGQKLEVPDMVEKKLEQSYAQIEQEGRRATRRGPSVKVALLAAALAVGCVLSIAAGLPAQVYNFVTGGSVVVEPGGAEVNFTLTGDEAASPVTVENGRLMFEANGQKLDITDQVDESTPYVQERTDPATGNKGYVIVGGTVDDYGWAEFFLTEDGTCSMMGENAWEYMVPVDGKDIPLGQLTEDQIDALNESDDNLMRTMNRPWLDKAVAQLGLEVSLGIAD